MDTITDPAMLGTVLTAIALIAGLVALRPQIFVLPVDAIDPAQPFSVPFRITNSGLLPVKHVSVICFVHRLELPGITVTDSLAANEAWKAPQIDRGETQTLIFNFAIAPVFPRLADIAIVVDYKPYGIPVSRRRAFRFQGARGEKWQWLAQPLGDIRDTVNDAVDKYYWEHQA